ncbi:ammonium transporter [Rhodococcus pyridinivorans]|uniref:ammonium transporter n=1 Tax=Rhodococcus pyridinivorans TaxID=103816 RepID=UPI00280AA702|nr:ammonium transporter [Rhodococcus pyridinivorans]WMM71965.1 ammonium transporter [Rhodococcus pyridinivorans]
MKLKKLAAVATMTIAAMGITAGTSHAAPAAQDEINYESKIEGDSVVTVIDAGEFQVSGDGESVELQDNAGNTVLSLPLAIQLGDLQLPFERQISEDGKTLTLTPVTDLSKATPVAPEDKVGASLTPVALKLTDVASPDENLKAQQNFASQLGIATAVGGLAGTIIGAVVGGLGLLGGPVGLASIPLGAGIGGVIGTIVAGGPTLIVAGIGLIQTLAAPPGTTVYAN